MKRTTFFSLVFLLLFIAVTVNAGEGFFKKKTKVVPPDFAEIMESTKIWSKSYGGQSYSNTKYFQQTLDGGYIAVGDVVPFPSDVGNNNMGNGIIVSDDNIDAWIIKFNKSGNIEWQRSYGDGLSAGIAPSSEYLNSIQQLPDGGYLAVGGFDLYGDEKNYSRIWMLKLDQSGDVQWQKAYGIGDHATANIIQGTSDGGYIIAGTAENFVEQNSESFAFYYDVFVFKFDSNWNIQWQKTYGWLKADEVHSMQQTADGGYIMAGITNGTYDGEPFDIWILKLAGNGEVEWQKTYEDGNIPTDARSIQQTPDGGYLVAGSAPCFYKNSHCLVLFKTDSYGKIKWQKTYENDVWSMAFDVKMIEAGWIKKYEGTKYSSAYSMQKTQDGNYIIVGQIESLAGDMDIWILKVDISGKILWQKIYGGKEDENPLSIQQTLDGGHIVAYEKVSSTIWSKELWILKLGVNGEATSCRRAKTTDVTVRQAFLVGVNSDNKNKDVNALEFTKDFNVLATDISVRDKVCP